MLDIVQRCQSDAENTDPHLHPRIMEMNISLASRINGFKEWSTYHPPSSNDDDIPGGARPIALEEPSPDRDVPENLPHRPWGIPGVGGTF